MEDECLVFIRVLDPIWYASIVVPTIENGGFDGEFALEEIVAIDLNGRDLFGCSPRGRYDGFVDAERERGHIVRHGSIELVFRCREACWKREERVFDDIRPVDPGEERLCRVLLSAVFGEPLA